MSDGQPVGDFNLFVGILAVLSAFTSCALFCRTLLPATQIDTFGQIMAQSKIIFLEADADGLIQEGQRESFSDTINKLEEEGRFLRDKLCQSRTVWEEYLTLFTKLQEDARKLVGRARYLRAWIASHTAQEKQKREQRREALARADRESMMQPTDPESIENHLDSPTITMVEDPESARVVELSQPAPPVAHDCQCTACPVHANAEAGLETNTAPTYIPIWKRLWRPSVKPGPEASPECQV